MKKRLISILLTVCMMASLVVLMPATASAAETVTYTLQRGDTVCKVCQKLGINFYANYNWIVKVNNIADFSKLPVGKVLTLPAPGTTPSINDVPGAATPSTPSTSTPAPGTGGTPSGGTATGKLLDGDYVSEYLVYHTMVSGETVSGVCKALGADFNANADRIMKLNNIKSWNRVPAGKVVLLPCVSLPASGTCLRVVAHKIVRGDTTYGICKSYGIDYNGYASILKVLNNKDNLASIKAGQILYVPVPAAIVNGSVSGGGTGTGTGTGTGGTQNPDPNQTYTITANTVNTNYGSYTVSASSAKAGALITVNVTPKPNYALGSITVTDSKGGAVKVNMNGNSATFNMPANNVSVTVKFVSAEAYTIYRGTASNGSFETRVNGKAVDKAAADQYVQVTATPAYGYEIDTITVSYNSGKNFIAVDGNDGFIMPERAVKVDVSFKRMTEYKITSKSTVNGSYTTTLNGANVTKALAGETIKITPTPDSGYELSKITVSGNGTNVTVNSDNTFTMPRFAVTITVEFAKASYKVTTAGTENGSYSVGIVGGSFVQAEAGKAVLSAETGERVRVDVKPDLGYTLKEVTVTTASGAAVKLNENNAFNMPAESVTVNVTFEKALFNVITMMGENSGYSVSVNGGTPVRAVNNTVVIQAHMGDTIKIIADDMSAYHYYLGSVTVNGRNGDVAVTGPTGKSNTATFIMPADEVWINISWVTLN